MASLACREIWLVCMYCMIVRGIHLDTSTYILIRLEYPFELFEEHECEGRGWSHAEERW
jgi:hypothetical protein